MSSAQELRRLRAEIDELVEAHGSRRSIEDFAVYRGRIVEFCREVLHFEPWSKQVEVLESFVANKRTVVRGFHSAGKDAVLACCMAYAAYVERMLVLAISATERQLLGQLWRELSDRFHAAGDALPGQLYTADLRIEGEKRIIAMTSGSVSNLTGWHDHNGVFVCISEGQGEQVEAAAFDAAAANATDDASRIVVGGNPYKPEGRFFEVHGKDTWHKIRISAFDHPNVVEGRVVVPGGPSPSWPREMEEEYGRESPFYIGRVLAEFPTDSLAGLYTRDMLDRAIQLGRAGTFKRIALHSSPRLVADISRGIIDGTCVGTIYGPVVAPLEVWKPTTREEAQTWLMLVAQRLRLRAVTLNPEHPPSITVDDVGVGGGVTDRLRQLKARVVAFNGGSQAGNPARFANLRAESYWELRERLLRERIALPDDPKLVEDLLATDYTNDHAGRIIVENKDLIRKKLGRSPDRGDTVSMACQPSREMRVVRFAV